MRHSACLWLALTVSFAALAVGNPFLPCGGDVGLPCGGEVGGKLVDGSDGSAVGGKPAVLDSGREAAFAIERGPQLHKDPGFVLTSGRAVDATIVPASLRASGNGRLPLPVCPDAALAPLVVDVEEVAGETVWVLRDGRRMRRSREAGQPLLVPVTSLDK